MESSLGAQMTDEPHGADGWAWWQARRLRYNIALGVSGLVAYVATVALWWATHQPVRRTWQDGLATTLLLGTGFLLLMGAANVCFLIGPALEAWMRPKDPLRFRTSAYGLGFWASMALPFAFPLFNLALAIGSGAFPPRP